MAICDILASQVGHQPSRRHHCGILGRLAHVARAPCVPGVAIERNASGTLLVHNSAVRSILGGLGERCRCHLPSPPPDLCASRALVAALPVASKLTPTGCRFCCVRERVERRRALAVGSGAFDCGRPVVYIHNVPPASPGRQLSVHPARARFHLGAAAISPLRGPVSASSTFFFFGTPRVVDVVHPGASLTSSPAAASHPRWGDTLTLPPTLPARPSRPPP